MLTRGCGCLIVAFVLLLSFVIGGTRVAMHALTPPGALQMTLPAHSQLIVTETTYLYTAPDVTSTVIATLPAGTMLKADGPVSTTDLGQWAAVRSRQLLRSGWVHMNDVHEATR